MNADDAVIVQTCVVMTMCGVDLSTDPAATPAATLACQIAIKRLVNVLEGAGVTKDQILAIVGGGPIPPATPETPDNAGDDEEGFSE